MKSQPAQIGKLVINLPAKPLFETQSDSASKSVVAKNRRQLFIQSVIATGGRSTG